MFQRLVFTLATAASLCGLSIVYSAAMRPVVVIPVPPPQQTEEREFTEAKRPAENVRVAATYLPTKEWTLESKYMLRADQAFVYTEKWEPDKENSKRVHFRPFGMVWVTQDKEGQEQAVAVSSGSARLEFASNFDEKNPNTGRVVGAVLGDGVEITGPDGLHVEGQNFIFDEGALSLYTTNPVRFKFQAHSGFASQMRMKLIPAEGPPGLDRPHVYGVESIRLIGRGNPVVLHTQMPQGKEMRQVSIRCADDLEYTVATNTAVFTDDVGVWTGPKKARDWIQCDKLTMQFIPKKSGTSDQEADSGPLANEGQQLGNGYQKLERNLEFSWLEALDTGPKKGVVASKQRVKIHSELHGVNAYMTRLAYDAETQRLFMSSETQDVLVTRKGSELRAPEIEAQFGQQNTLSSLICKGIGVLKFVDEQTQRVAFVANWKKQLSKKLDEETKLDLIELDEQAQFRQPQRAGLGADLIKIWLIPIAFGLPTSDEDQNDPAKTPEPDPKRLLAVGDVAFQSPQMMIQGTNELDIRFDEEDAAQTAVRQRSRSHLRPAGMSLQTGFESRRPPFPAGTTSTVKSRASASSQVGFASIPTDPDGLLGPPVEIPSTSSPEPIWISADRIGVRLRRVPDRSDPAVKEVHAQGKVTIAQLRKDGERPMRLEGDRVDMETESEKHEIVHVHGTPALIRDRGFEIEGKNIHLDRGANRAWVSGAGTLNLLIPTETKILGMKADAEKKLIVRWDESMEFNGLEATFLSGVNAKLGLGSMTCEQMRVRLVSRMSFQADSVTTQPDLHSVRCSEKVTFMNSSQLDKKVTDIYRGRVSEFEVDYVTGHVSAQGPGEIHSWQRRKNRDETQTRDTIQANRPIPVEVTVWNYTGMQFEGKLKGSFDGQKTGHPTHQQATVDDRVEVIHGPVKLPGEKIDPDNLPSEAGTIRCGQLEVVNHPAGDRNPVDYLTLVGRVNTEIEGQVDGRRFTASADNISFDGSKGLYILRGQGRQNARLAAFGSNHVVVGQEINFNPDPKLRILRVVRAVEGQGSQTAK